MRIVIARCRVEYRGRLSTALEEALRLLVFKADGTVLVHNDSGGKPLNWMSAPCRVTEFQPDSLGSDGSSPEDTCVFPVWQVTNNNGELLTITLYEVFHDTHHNLGIDPGLVKDGVEAHLQKLLADHVETFGLGWTLIRREFPTAIGPVDLLCRDEAGACVAIEVKRRGEIDGVEQLSRYLDLLNRDPLISPVRGVLVAQEIKPQARVLAQDRGIDWMVVDYEELQGKEDPSLRLF